MRMLLTCVVAIGLAVGCGSDAGGTGAGDMSGGGGGGDGGGNGDGGGGNGDGGGGGADDDGDGVPNATDNCAGIPNPDQYDFDNDGKGDPCDPDPPTMTCGDQEPDFVRAEPNILIILDRSLSMSMGGNPNKWEQARSALDQVAMNLADQLRMGLAVFPGRGTAGNCGDATLELAMGDHTAAEVMASYDDPLAPNGYTPMRRALEKANSENWTSDASDPDDAKRKKAILFITDGTSNYKVGQEGDRDVSDHTAVLTAVDALTTKNIPTYVVGFGNGVDADNLNEMAQHGGTDNPADPTNRYYQANDGAALETALLSISGALISCELVITGTPTDPTRIYVDFGGMHLVRDAADGFVYDAMKNAIILQGSACTNLKASPTTSLTIIFGCPPDGSPPIG